MKYALFLALLPLTACMKGGPFVLCPVAMEERVSTRKPLPELDQASLDDWFDAHEDAFSWDVSWTDLEGAPETDTLTLTLEQRGRPRVLQLQLPPAGTPNDLAAACLRGRHVVTDVRVELSTASGATGTADGVLFLPSADLADARGGFDIRVEGPAWITPDETRPGCVGEPHARIAFDASGGLEQPFGSVSAAHDNCRGTWGSWTSTPAE